MTKKTGRNKFCFTYVEDVYIQTPFDLTLEYQTYLPQVNFTI
jgi:hypothetical protein